MEFGTSMTFAVLDTASISSATMSSAAARLLLLQAAHLPLISPLDVNMLIEREITNTSESTSAGADSILCRGRPTNDRAASNSTASTYQSASVPQKTVCEDVASDNCDQKPSVKNAADHRLHKLETDNNEGLCSVKETPSTRELHFHCKPDLMADVKKSEVVTSNGGRDPPSCSLAEKTSSGLSARGNLDLPRRSSTTLSGLGQKSLSAKEINNNCRHGYAGRVRKEKVGSGVNVGCGAAIRKSKRCNRGRRYNELMSQGVLQHHASRKRCESLTV